MKGIRAGKWQGLLLACSRYQGSWAGEGTLLPRKGIELCRACTMQVATHLFPKSLTVYGKGTWILHLHNPFLLLLPFQGAQQHDLGPALALVSHVSREASRQLCGKNAQLNLQLVLPGMVWGTFVFSERKIKVKYISCAQTQHGVILKLFFLFYSYVTAGQRRWRYFHSS